MPSSEAISANMEALADYAKIVQNNNMVPMVEPEVLMDGAHSIDDCYDATSRCLESLFSNLIDRGVDITGTILKPNMVTSGSKAFDPDVTILGLRIVPVISTPLSIRLENRDSKQREVAS